MEPAQGKIDELHARGKRVRALAQESANRYATGDTHGAADSIRHLYFDNYPTASISALPNIVGMWGFNMPPELRQWEMLTSRERLFLRAEYDIIMGLRNEIYSHFEQRAEQEPFPMHLVEQLISALDSRDWVGVERYWRMQNQKFRQRHGV